LDETALELVTRVNLYFNLVNIITVTTLAIGSILEILSLVLAFYRYLKVIPIDLIEMTNNK
jgi:hypothetical protein